MFNIHIFDNTQGKYWPKMTDAERAASATNPGAVVFDGATVNAAVPSVLPGSVVSVDDANATGPTMSDACTALTNVGAVAGKIALVDRGTCGFTIKVKNAQNAGAIGVIVADNAAGPVVGMGGFDQTIVIPDPLGQAAGGSDATAAARHRLVRGCGC